MNFKRCCLCGGLIDKQKNPLTRQVFWDDGHNAEPLSSGRCCSICNDTKVIPARIANISRR